MDKFQETICKENLKKMNECINNADDHLDEARKYLAFYEYMGSSVINLYFDSISTVNAMIGFAKSFRKYGLLVEENLKTLGEILKTIPHLEELYEAYKKMCEDYNTTVKIVNSVNNNSRIIPCNMDASTRDAYNQLRDIYESWKNNAKIISAFFKQELPTKEAASRKESATENQRG